MIAILPASSRDITMQVSEVTQCRKSVKYSAIGTLLLTVWSSSKGRQALIIVTLPIINITNDSFLWHWYVFYFHLR